MSTTAAGDSPKKSKSTKPPLKEKKPQAAKPSNDRLKIVVRRLPANLPEEVFWQSVQQWVTDNTVSWKAFYGGKLKKRLNKENVPSRAYLVFKNEEDLAVFSREYDGHLFRDKAGNETQAVVEFAPYQKVPPEKGKADSRIATIESDEDYISFLESLKVEHKPFDEDTLESLIASTQPPPVPKTTPLIEALIAEKSAQRDKEAILRNHVHYKDQVAINGTSKRDDKKKGPPAPPPPKPSGEQGKKSAKKAQKANKAPPAQAAASSKNAPSAPTPAPTIMSKPNTGSKSPQSPQKAPRPPKPPAAATNAVLSPSEDSNNVLSTTTTATTAPMAGILPAPPTGKRARPVIGIASRQFEAALNGAGVKSKKGGKEKPKDDAMNGGDAKLSTAAKVREENMNARIDVPTILGRDDEVGGTTASSGVGRGGARGRGRGRGRGGHRGG